MNASSFPNWTRLKPDSSNSSIGWIYLRSLNLKKERDLYFPETSDKQFLESFSPYVFDADRVAFYMQNQDVEYEIQVEKFRMRCLNSSDGDRELVYANYVVLYQGQTFQIISGGILKKDGIQYLKLKDYPNQPYSGPEKYPFPFSSQSKISQDPISHLRTTSENKMEIASENVSQLFPHFHNHQVYCFDLDRTLTQKHISGLSKSGYSDEALFNLILHPHHLRNLFNQLLQENKCIYIVTFSDKLCFESGDHSGHELVSRLLQMITPDADKIKILAYYPPLYGYSENKNHHLHQALSESQQFYQKKISPSDVLLIDDSGRNIEAAQAEGFATYHVPEGLFNM